LTRIVNGEENVEHDISRNYGFVKVNSRDFGVPGSSRTNRLIAGIVDVATHVADLDIDNALELHVAAVETPEATAT
jgi:hypothetical protein